MEGLGQPWGPCSALSTFAGEGRMRILEMGSRQQLWVRLGGADALGREARLGPERFFLEPAAKRVREAGRSAVMKDTPNLSLTWGHSSDGGGVGRWLLKAVGCLVPLPSGHFPGQSSPSAPRLQESPGRLSVPTWAGGARLPRCPTNQRDTQRPSVGPGCRRSRGSLCTPHPHPPLGPWHWEAFVLGAGLSPHSLARAGIPLVRALSPALSSRRVTHAGGGGTRAPGGLW